jgi:hypothetical protein
VAAISVATAGPPNGLTKQVEGLIGVLDDMMMHLRDAILSYVISEAGVAAAARAA